jgi:hypothetical protein
MASTKRSATYQLAQVTAVARLAIIGGRVVRRTADDYPVDLPKVTKFIVNTVASLKSNEFVRPELQEYHDRPSIMADIYAVTNDDGSWYVKFYLEHGRVTVLSCHEPRDPLTRIDGIEIKASK